MTPLDEIVAATVARTVVEHLGDRDKGHCMQVANLPDAVADGACRLAHQVLEPQGQFARYAVDGNPTEEWHATPTKIVELRNHVDERESKLVVFIPSGEHLAVEDSFGESTFEVFEIGDLYRTITADLATDLAKTDPELADRASEVLSVIRGSDRFRQNDEAVAAFLSRLVATPSREELGRALVELELLPDAGIPDADPDDLKSRLIRNQQQMMALVEPSLPTERLRRLPLDPRKNKNKPILNALADVLADGTLDQHALAQRFDDPDVRAKVDFSNWQMGSVDARPDEFKVLRLIGDLSGDAEPTMTKSVASIGVRFRCRPAPDRLDGLESLTLEVVRIGEREGELFETGYEATKRSSLPKQPEAQWRIKVDSESLDERDSLFCFRLRAWSEDNALLAEAKSVFFRIGDELPEAEPEVAETASVAAARVAARGAAAEVDVDAFRNPTLTVDTRLTGEDAKKTIALVVRFGHATVASQMRISKILSMLERETLSDPEQLGRYSIELGESEISEVIEYDAALPKEFTDRRAALFTLIRETQLAVEGEERPPYLVALCDLTQLADEINGYVAAWVSALAEAQDASTLRLLLGVDQVALTENGRELGQLIGPTHPLRLMWLARYQQLLEDWVWNDDTTPREATELASILETLHPANVPHVLISDYGALREIQPVDLYWAIYGVPSSADSTALAARIRSWLRMETTATATVSVADVVQRIRRYLVAHPYVDLLKLNFVEPGLGHVILETLLRLQDDPATEHLRYAVRLFSGELTRMELGRALDDFMADPDASRTARKQAADAFLASSDNPLEPKLTYSKHHVDDLLAAPQNYPAHLTLFLDSFDLKAVAAAPVEDRRSFFGSGLIVEPVVVYRASDDTLDPQWDEHVAANSTSGDRFISAFAAAETATARALNPQGGPLVPVVRLELDRVRRAVLDAVHRSSDWVVVIDPVFTDEYLDTPPAEGETTRFLIDYAAPLMLETGRRIVVSTRSRSELRDLLRPVANQHGLELPADRVDALLDGLQLLGSGLGLKLLNNRTQALEAFSMALGSLYLAESGVLRRAVAIPLDLHQDLFREGQRHDPSEIAYLTRTDLGVIQIDPADRKFGVHLVELKARSGDVGVAQLLDHIGGQLENSRKVLRTRLFGADLRETPGSLAAALQVRRLSKLLSRYVERASRYELLDETQLEATRRFVANLDEAYSVGFEKHALVFDLNGESRAAERIGDVRVVVIGRSEIQDIIKRTRTPVATLVVENAEALEQVFGEGSAASERIAAVAETAEKTQGPGVEPEPVAAARPARPDDGLASEGPAPDAVDIIGTAPTTSQFGIVASLASSGRPIALDLSGTNVVSVFGVQGSGKSYTVGTLLEAGLVGEPTLNRLPRPLAGIVFHYTNDLTYAPEFAAMGSPNDDLEATTQLKDEYSAPPRGVDELVVLVPEALLQERRAEFPDLRVEPLLLGPEELNLNDWRLLMGLQGGEQMYARSMNGLFRQLRDEVSLESLREAVEESGMTKHQKMLATTRIEFAAQFVRDGGGVAHHVGPGRLVIVDMRDELIEQDEALAIFMVLLNRFGQVSDETESLNKIIVFDEAHKYMGNARLTQAIVDNIRLMRHRGTTVILASQDPPSVPKEVIELSSVIVTHRFTSPKWLEHVRKVSSAFGEAAMQPSQLARLAAGEAFLWSVGGPDAFRRPQRIRIRPRMSRHGGATRRAV
jgi:hypothetical protein